MKEDIPEKEISELRRKKQNRIFKQMRNIKGILLISQTTSRLEGKDLKLYYLNDNLPL